MRPSIYLLWAMLLPLIVITVSVLVSIWLGYAAAASFSNAAGGATGHLLRVLKGIGIYTVISILSRSAKSLGGGVTRREDWCASLAC